VRIPAGGNTQAAQLNELRRAQIAAVAENSARLAFAYGDYNTTGLGQFAFNEQVSFDLAFIERPFMSYGYVYDFDDNDSVVLYPRATGFVWDWHVNTKGLYVGASVGVCVDTPAVVNPAPSFALEHHFSFAGLAMKVIPANLLVD
jgi:hypothetical protein